jgi:hypothetical protein
MGAMRRRRVTAWLLSVPLMVVGSQAAHVVAYRLVYPSAHVRVSELLATGHGYMGAPAYVPLLLGLVLAAELVWVGSALVAGVRRTLQRPVSPWAFAMLPMLAFTLQELLERWLSGTTFPWWMVLQPTFRVGLALQIPFALVAYLVARLLLAVAEEVSPVLRGVAARVAPQAASVLWSVAGAAGRRPRVLRGGRPVRGPPGAGPALVAFAH